MISELLKNAMVTFVIGVSKSAFGGILAKAEMICFARQGLSSEDNVTKAFTVRQLSEHQDQKLVVTSEVLNIPVAVIFPHEVVEMVAVKEV